MAQQPVRYDRGWLADDDRLGGQSLLQLLLGHDDSDGLVAEPAALEFARRDFFRRELAAAAQARRIIPERRHLRK
ncbi:MAG: hypothetical protein H6649_03875 [Caldilineae bacterium]|nr:hypothetical protein [Anaerolineae bacterium]MCB0205113.1 hypothetical protein [Anaerolineae bacterium]MCB0257797.1 hypothetical protein [Anaerolineae bacterium]MCB9153182.1 hypothetical protein [Caldilineae bacterium]